VDVVDYDDVGRTTFSGRSQPGSRVRVYVDDRFAGEAAAGDDGTWSLSAGHDIEPGSHTLRTDQLADNGTVNERIELPFFRETTKRIAELQAQRASTVQSDVSAPQPAAEPAAKAETAPAVDQQKNTEIAVAAAPDEAAGTSTQGASQPDAVVVEPVQKEEPVQTATAAASVEPDEATEEPAPTGKVVIQPGNNLWQISRVIYGKGRQYTLIYEANKDQIRNPDRIYPGQIFEAPGSTAPESIDPKCRRPLAECQ
jgi:nucleoid-associated protein YgaU